MSFLRDFWPAVIAAVLVGAAAPAIGTFVVQRRLSLIGDGLGHMAFAGVAVGLWLQISPLVGALCATIAGALWIDRLRRRAPGEADLILAAFFYGSIAAALVIASGSQTSSVKLVGFLFGQVLTVSQGEVATIAGLAFAVAVVVALLYRGLAAAAIDEEAAAVVGVPVTALNNMLMALAAVAVAVGMQVVGILLIAALMVLPVGIARNLVRSLRAVVVLSAALGAGAALAGLLIASEADTAPSGTIVLLLTAAFILSSLPSANRILGRAPAGGN